MGLNYVGVDIDIPKNILKPWKESYELLIDCLRDIIEKSRKNPFFVEIIVGGYRAELLLVAGILLSAKLYREGLLIAEGVEAWAILEDLGEQRYVEALFYPVPSIVLT